MTKKLNLKKLQQDFQNDYEQDQAKKRAIAKQSVGINGSKFSHIRSY